MNKDYPARSSGSAPIKLIGIIAVLVLGGIIFLTTVSGTYTNVNANEIHVTDILVNGTLTINGITMTASQWSYLVNTLLQSH